MKLLGVVAEMTLEDVIDVLAALDAGGIVYWVDGGWALMRCTASRPEHTVTSTSASGSTTSRGSRRCCRSFDVSRRRSGRASYASGMSVAVSWTCCSLDAAKPASFGSNLREGDEFATRRAKPAHRDVSGVARSGVRASHFSLSTTITRRRPIRTAPISRR